MLIIEPIKVEEAAIHIQSRLHGFEPQIGLILGSGLGDLADQIEEPIHIPYQDVPHFPVSTITGHAGRWVAGELAGVKVLIMQGRFHGYEGYSMQEVTFPVRVMKKLGIGRLLVTNASGGINPSFEAGDLMLITDHINFMFQNPLTGRNVEAWGPRFPDMSQAYTPQLQELAVRVAESLQIGLKKGVYIGVTGPSYETPAEIVAFSRLGADAVGMSTVPEVIVARHQGMEVLGISCITNMAAGILDKPLSHQEVMETAQSVKGMFSHLIVNILHEMSSNLS